MRHRRDPIQVCQWCAESLHNICDGTAYDDDADREGLCPCAEVGH